MEEGRCLTDGELIKSFRTSDIVKNFRLREELMRHAETIEFANHTESDIQDQGFREKFPTYLGQINRISQNEFYGGEDLIGDGRYVLSYAKDAHVENYNERNRRNDTDRTFPRRNRPNQYVDCAVWGTWGWCENEDNRDYNDEESDNPDYYWGHEEGRSLLEENGGIIPPIELEDEAIDGRRTDSDVDAYLANSRVPNEYRDAKTYYRS